MHVGGGLDQVWPIESSEKSILGIVSRGESAAIGYEGLKSLAISERPLGEM